MLDFVGVLLFLTAVGLTGVKIETFIAPYPQWVVIPAFVFFFFSILVYAAAIAVIFT